MNLSLLDAPSPVEASIVRPTFMALLEGLLLAFNALCFLALWALLLLYWWSSELLTITVLVGIFANFLILGPVYHIWRWRQASKAYLVGTLSAVQMPINEGAQFLAGVALLIWLFFEGLFGVLFFTGTDWSWELFVGGLLLGMILGPVQVFYFWKISRLRKRLISHEQALRSEQVIAP